MELFINNKSGAPIYDQIYNQIKQQIISGALQPDEAMPSIRGLARDLRISVITTKRAYDELEKEGFLYAVPAKGFFVAPKNTELLREETLKKIEVHLTEAVRLSASCGLSREELREMLGISRQLAYKLIDYGYIHAVKIGTTLKIPKISVINYVMEKKVKKVG